MNTSNKAMLFERMTREVWSELVPNITWAKRHNYEQTLDECVRIVERIVDLLERENISLESKPDWSCPMVDRRVPCGVHVIMIDPPMDPPLRVCTVNGCPCQIVAQ